MEKWCKGDQTWGIVKEKTSVLILRKKIKCSHWCLQKYVFCFSWQHLFQEPLLLCYYKFIWKVHGAERLASSQYIASCHWLWTEALFFFPLISFPSLCLWNLSRWIKIDQGLLYLINSTIWLHFTKIQTLWVSLSQHYSLWLSKACFPWTIVEFNQQMKTTVFLCV